MIIQKSDVEKAEAVWRTFGGLSYEVARGIEKNER